MQPKIIKSIIDNSSKKEGERILNAKETLEIISNYEKQGYLIHKGKLSINEIVKYLKIDIEYLTKLKDIN